MYLDILFLVNFSADLLLLAATAALTGTPLRPPRLLAAAAADAAAGVLLWFLPGASARLPLRLACALLAVLIAYGAHELRRALLYAGALFAVSCALAGVLTLTRLTFLGLLFAGLGLWLLSSALTHLRARNEAPCAEALLEHGTRRVRLRALRDTGHCLLDPVTNRPVLVVSYPALRPLLPESAAAVLDRMGAADAPALLEALARAGVRGFTLVPYRAVGVEGGLLAAFAPERASLDGHAVSLLAAVSPTPLPDAYDALAGAA